MYQDPSGHYICATQLNLYKKYKAEYKTNKFTEAEASQGGTVADYNVVGGGTNSFNVGKEDLDSLRTKLGVPETNTIAVGKTNIKGLENMVFEGGSPAVRRMAELEDIDIIYPNRDIRSSGKIPSATRHAEEVDANKFVEAVNTMGLEIEDLKRATSDKDYREQLLRNII